MIRMLFTIALLYSLQTMAQPPVTRPIPGKVVGQLPYLEYGLGSDRLGGAKMTYLDTGVIVRVVDSTIGNYKIQLSRTRFAYLPKENFKKDTLIRLQPYYLTGAWMVNGDSLFDYVSIALDERLPYTSVQQVNPSKIIVDVFGATSNTSWITQLSSAKEIKSVSYEQTEDDQFRVVIDLKHQQHWGYSIFYRGKRLVIKVKRQPKELSLEHMRIAVDAGHGGDNNGASGKTGILEKNYTLLIAKQLERELKDKEANVYMTRTGDESLDMVERTLMIRKQDPDFLISVHLNSAANDTVRGTSTYYRYPGFRPLSKYILESMLKLGLKEYGNIGNFNFALCGPTEYPNVLVEVAFLSNKQDEQLIRDPNFHKQVAEQIVEGVKEWLKACKKDDE